MSPPAPPPHHLGVVPVWGAFYHFGERLRAEGRGGRGHRFRVGSHQGAGGCPQEHRQHQAGGVVVSPQPTRLLRWAGASQSVHSIPEGSRWW